MLTAVHLFRLMGLSRTLQSFAGKTAFGTWPLTNGRRATHAVFNNLPF